MPDAKVVIAAAGGGMGAAVARILASLGHTPVLMSPSGASAWMAG